SRGRQRRGPRDLPRGPHVGPPTLQEGEHSTTLLGEWYAIVPVLSYPQRRLPARTFERRRAGSDLGAEGHPGRARRPDISLAISVRRSRAGDHAPTQVVISWAMAGSGTED